jgi:hypothetical protein
MSEAIKSVIFSQGEVEVDGKKLNKYLVGMVLITDSPIQGINDLGENIAMGGNLCYNQVTESLSNLPKYKSHEKLGDLDSAMLTISKLSPADLIKTHPTQEDVVKQSNGVEKNASGSTT